MCISSMTPLPCSAQTRDIFDGLVFHLRLSVFNVPTCGVIRIQVTYCTVRSGLGATYGPGPKTPIRWSLRLGVSGVTGRFLSVLRSLRCFSARRRRKVSNPFFQLRYSQFYPFSTPTTPMAPIGHSKLVHVLYYIVAPHGGHTAPQPEYRHIARLSLHIHFSTCPVDGPD